MKMEMNNEIYKHSFLTSGKRLVMSASRVEEKLVKMRNERDGD